MKISLILIANLLCATIVAQSINDNIKQIEGHWSGTLTYTDYRDDLSESTLKCQMKCQWKRNKGTLSMGFTEPNGKMVYDKTKIKMYSNRKKLKFDGATYAIDTYDMDDESGYWTLVISTKGKDNQKPAIIQQSIQYKGSTLSILKEVKYDDSLNYFTRNKYSFNRE